jgi:DNA-3-methyladenine glycosylase II
MPGHASAARELARRDTVVASLVQRHGLMRIPARPAVRDRFAALARNIVYQQLAGRAAAAIWARTLALAGDRPFDAGLVVGLDDTCLRRAGLSAAKAAAVRDLAEHVLDGRLRLDRLGRLADDEVVGALSQVRGVGPWTAHMFLLFHLHRLDVWPTGDYGVRVGYRVAWELEAVPSPRQLDALGERFRPYRSVAAWYCWRANEGVVTPGD